MKKFFLFEIPLIIATFFTWDFVNGLLQFLILLPAVIAAWWGLWQTWKQKTKRKK